MPTSLPVRAAPNRAWYARFGRDFRATERQGVAKKAKPNGAGFRWGFLHDAVAFVLVVLATMFVCANAEAGTAAPVHDETSLTSNLPTIDMVVERRGDSVEIYLGGNAQTVSNAFGADPSVFTNAEGFVPFDSFQSGTWSLGDRLLSGVSIDIGGSSHALEATSLMLHPADLHVPFRNAVDAVMAVSICAVLNPPDNLTLDDASLYAGYIAFTQAANEPIMLRGNTLPGAIKVRILDFWDGQLVGEAMRVWSAQEPLMLPATPALAPVQTSAFDLAVPYPLMAFMLFFGLLGVGTFIRQRVVTT